MSTASDMTILVVEDDAATRKMMRLTLQAEGYAVEEAENGQAALQLVAKQAPALVLLDCALPDLDGFEVGRRLRLLSRNLPVIAVAGWAQANEPRLLAAGFLDLVVRPVEPSHLIEVVARHVGQAPARVFPSGRTVLLADDDPTQRKLAQLAFSKSGFEVIAAEDGEAAFRLATERIPDVIVCDVLMPRMDGFAVCKAIRSDPKLAGVPIVLMSAHYLEEEDRHLAARFGANRYVSRAEGLDAVVRAALEALEAPVPQPALSVDDLPDLQTEYLRRVANQLERQARIGIGVARRVSLQASALSLLDGISDTLARQLDPESVLDDTLARCLDAAGLSIGAIFLGTNKEPLALKAWVGSGMRVSWETHAALLSRAISEGDVILPSVAAAAAGDALLAALGAASALIVPIAARGESLGALLLASSGADFAGSEGKAAVRAAQSIARQLGQALALSRMFSKLASAERHYRALFENAGDAIGLLTPEGVILEANRGWAEITGLTPAELVGHHLSDFAPEGEEDARKADFQGAVARGGGTEPPVRFRRRNGELVQVELSRTIIEVAGSSHVLVIGRDVSERLRLEELLRQSQKMEAVGRLAGGIAHDFNNVLTVILTYGDTLLDELSPGEPMRLDVEEICKAGRRAADLTRQLLMFSRQQVIEPRVIDLNHVLKETDRMLQRIVGADIDLVSVLTPEIGRVRIDPGSMEQVIMNLVVNARDAMPTGGKLTLETADVMLDERYAGIHPDVKAGPYVMLAATDTGSGMDKATQARIFEPFYSTKGLGKGTGLGLATVFGIVRQAGGSIWVYSEVGRGTTFKIYLPRVTAEIDAVRPVQPVALRRGSETVLLVEDDEQVRVVTASILRKNGYQVLEASNAGAALLHSEQHAGAIDLLLTDVVMPQVSGPELARRLVTLRPAMKLLCMSGYTDDSILRHGILEAHIAYLQKPLTPLRLMTKVRQVLDETDVRGEY
ncbi:MAG TPA: response regulator [Polyangia bacterium]